MLVGRVRIVPVSTAWWACVWPHDPSRQDAGRSPASTVSTAAGDRLGHRLRHRRRRMTPAGRAILRMSHAIPPDAVLRQASTSLELQRLQTLLNVHLVELHAKLV